MNLVIILSLLLVAIILATFVVLFFSLTAIGINLKTKVPWVKTPANNLEIILDEIKLPSNSLVYDLGCGDGRFLFAAKKRGLRTVGYELSLYPCLRGWLRSYFSGTKVIIKNSNYFNSDLSEADTVYLFLVGAVMAKTGEKLKRELKPGTLVISYGFKIPGWEITKTLPTHPSQTYVYYC